MARFIQTAREGFKVRIKPSNDKVLIRPSNTEVEAHELGITTNGYVVNTCDYTLEELKKLQAALDSYIKDQES